MSAPGLGPGAQLPRLESSDWPTAGRLLAFDGERVTALTPIALAPGTPVSWNATAAGSIGEDQVVIVEGRVMRSRRRGDGRFEVLARLVNLRREDRLRLEAWLVGAAAVADGQGAGAGTPAESVSEG